MRTVIIYASTHHGNTRKVVEAISNEFNVELVDATKVHEWDLSQYDLIGFASGIFFAKFAKPVLEFARTNLPAKKEVFLIATAGNPMDLNFHSIADIVSEMRCREVGRFQCKGFDTYGPFKLVGGIQKGHPDQKDLRAAVEFYKEILECNSDR